MSNHPGARVVASDLDERAVACATKNGVEVYVGDLFAPLPRTLEGGVDVVVGVVPYVPTPALPFLQRDTFAFESPLAYDGGRDGTEVLRRVLRDARSSWAASSRASSVTPSHASATSMSAASLTKTATSAVSRRRLDKRARELSPPANVYWVTTAS